MLFSRRIADTQGPYLSTADDHKPDRVTKLVRNVPGRYHQRLTYSGNAGNTKKVSDSSLVSVVIPTRNRLAYLQQAIESARAQNVEMELLVVDDASDAEVAQAIPPLLKPGERLLRCNEARGGAAARNVGLHQARGELVAFLDDDDIWLPGKLAAQMECMKRAGDNIVAVYCGYHYLQQETGKKFPAPPPRYRGNVHRVCLEHCITPTSTMLARRKALIDAGGFDECLPAGQDWDFWIRLSRLGDFDFVDQDLVSLRVHGVQISGNLHRYIQARRRIIDKYAAEIQNDLALQACHFHRLGVLYMLAGDSKRGRQLLSAACRHQLRLRYFTHLAVSLCPPLYRWLVSRFGMFRAGDTVFFH